jgi:hypothetical protein
MTKPIKLDEFMATLDLALRCEKPNAAKLQTTA